MKQIKIEALNKGFIEKIARDMPSFTSQARPSKVKDIYKALKREHPGMPAEMKARIAARQGKKGKQKQGPPYKAPIKSTYKAAYVMKDMESHMRKKERHIEKRMRSTEGSLQTKERKIENRAKRFAEQMLKRDKPGGEKVTAGDVAKMLRAKKKKGTSYIRKGMK